MSGRGCMRVRKKGLRAEENWRGLLIRNFFKKFFKSICWDWGMIAQIVNHLFLWGMYVASHLFHSYPLFMSSVMKWKKKKTREFCIIILCTLNRIITWNLHLDSPSTLTLWMHLLYINNSHSSGIPIQNISTFTNSHSESLCLFLGLLAPVVPSALLSYMSTNLSSLRCS